MINYQIMDIYIHISLTNYRYPWLNYVHNCPYIGIMGSYNSIEIIAFSNRSTYNAIMDVHLHLLSISITW